MMSNTQLFRPELNKITFGIGNVCTANTDGGKSMRKVNARLLLYVAKMSKSVVTVAPALHFHCKSVLYWDLIPDDDTCLF